MGRARPWWRQPSVTPVALGFLVIALATSIALEPGDGLEASGEAAGSSEPDPAPASEEPRAERSLSAGTPATEAKPEPETFEGWVDPASFGQPYGDQVEGLLTFRGNPTRSLYGRGPVPERPHIGWRYPAEGGLCGMSTVGSETTQWCGTGWTGQPAVFERDDRTWVVFGAYDHQVHFLDAETGEQIIPSFRTGDIIKGSVTIDPDGYPLVYTGSRDDRYRVLAIDRDHPEELWSLHANDVSPTLWNTDWDGAGLIIDDYLFVGGENSRFHIVKLNRGYNPDGQVTVAPELVFDTAGWDDELLNAIGDRNVSIENSVAISGNVVYFANSGGLVQGWDISALEEGGEPQRVFRFWTGDDTDATIVIDDEGMLYVASEWERFNQRARDVGQIMKLDPSRPDDPLVWSHKDQPNGIGGVWGTPALHENMLYVPTNGGELLGLGRATGELQWSKQLSPPTWSSPVVVDDVLLQGDCAGDLHAYDVSEPAVEPPELWTVSIGGCVESTPAVWNGGIYVGTRAGQVVAITDEAD
jgi:outer membrane protein assembly factor BamB